MLKHLKISQKIYLLGGIQLVLMMLMGITAITQMAKIGIELMDIAEVDIPLTKHLTQVTEHQLQQNIYFERALFNLAILPLNIPNAKKHLTELKTKISNLKDITNKEIQETKKFVDNAISVIHTEEGKEKFKKVKKDLEKIDLHYRQFNQGIIDTLNHPNQSNLTELVKKAEKVETIEDLLTQEMIDVLNDVQSFTLEASIQAEKDEQSGIKWIIGSFIAAISLGLILPFFVSRAITRPIVQLSERLTEISKGDGDLTLSIENTTNDETGDVSKAFNQFLAVLRDLIKNTNSQADDLGKSSEVALKAMQSTVANVEKQRSETEQVALAVNQMHNTTQEVASSANHAAEFTNEVKNKVTEGKKNAEDTQTLINQLSQEVGEASEVIKSLVDETNNIGNVLESIQGIAEQTNLLALNAAIEAARAGESGRGFAVVADEVRTLAQRTQTSTEDIQQLLLRLKTEADNAVISMNKGSESASVCLEKSVEANKTFEDASNAVLQISDLNAQIASAAEEQSAVAEEVNQNLVNINSLAEITANGANDTSEANTIIAKRVIDLHSNLNIFIV